MNTEVIDATGYQTSVLPAAQIASAVAADPSLQRTSQILAVARTMEGVIISASIALGVGAFFGYKLVARRDS